MEVKLRNFVPEDYLKQVESVKDLDNLLESGDVDSLAKKSKVPKIVAWEILNSFIQLSPKKSIETDMKFFKAIATKDVNNVVSIMNRENVKHVKIFTKAKSEYEDRVKILSENEDSLRRSIKVKTARIEDLDNNIKKLSSEEKDLKAKLKNHNKLLAEISKIEHREISGRGRKIQIVSKKKEEDDGK